MEKIQDLGVTIISKKRSPEKVTSKVGNFELIIPKIGHF